MIRIIINLVEPYSNLTNLKAGGEISVSKFGRLLQKQLTHDS